MMETTKRKVHIWKDFEYKTHGIHKISKYNQFSNNKIALSRRDGSLEIWTSFPKNKYWTNEFKVNGKRDYLIESLFWSKLGHLITADSEGFISEINLKHFYKPTKINIDNKSITCMDYCPKNDTIIASLDDGHIKLLSCNPLSVVKTVSKEKSPISCINWHVSGEHFLFSTLSHGVYMFNVSSNSSIPIISFVTKSPRIFWSCLFLSDWTLVLAESTGSVQFWDGIGAVQLQSFSSHKADVLDLCVSSNEEKIFSCSSDKTICCYLHDSKNRRIVSRSARYHHNDITSLAYNTDQSLLISASADSLINLYTFENFELKLFNSFGLSNQFSKFKTSIKGSRVLYIEARHSSIYQFSDSPPEYLVRISNETHSYFITGSISNCGNLCSLSTSNQFFIYKINENLNIEKLNVGSISRQSYLCGAFSDDSSLFSFLSQNFELFILNVKTNKIEHSMSLRNFDFEHFGKCELYLFWNRFALLVIESYPCVSKIIDCSTGEVHDVCNLMRNIVSSTFVSQLNHLVLLDIRHRLFIIDIFNPHKMVFFKLKLKNQSYDDVVRGIFCDSDSLIFHSLNKIYKLPLSSLNQTPHSIDAHQKKIKLKAHSQYNPIIYSSLFVDGSLLILTKNFTDIYSSSLQPIVEKRFRQN